MIMKLWVLVSGKTIGPKRHRKVSRRKQFCEGTDNKFRFRLVEFEGLGNGEHLVFGIIVLAFESLGIKMFEIIVLERMVKKNVDPLQFHFIV